MPELRDHDPIYGQRLQSNRASELARVILHLSPIGVASIDKESAVGNSQITQHDFGGLLETIGRMAYKLEDEVYELEQMAGISFSPTFGVRPQAAE